MLVKPKRIWKRKREVTIRIVHVFLSTLRILLYSWIQKKNQQIFLPKHDDQTYLYTKFLEIIK